MFKRPMNANTHKPAPRAGLTIQIARERITIYLRLLQLTETVVADLTDKILTRIPGKEILPAVLEILKENNIAPNAHYHPLFTDAYKPPPRRTPMGYRAGDPKNSIHRDKRRTFILGLRRSIFFSLILVSTIIGTLTITTILSPHGLTFLKWAIIVIFTFLFGWISINFWTVIFGFFLSLRKGDPFLAIPPKLSPIASTTKIALVMPVYNEEVPRIFAALRAMYDTVEEAGVLDHFDIYV